MKTVKPSRHTDGDVPGVAATDDGWPADDALFPRRLPILSHRAPRPPRRRAWLTATALALVVATIAGRVLPDLVGSQPIGAQDVSVPPIRDPMNSQTLTSDHSGDPAPYVQPVTSTGGTPSAPAGSSRWRSAASGTHPAAPPPTTPHAPPPPTVGPPVATVVAPADGLTVWVVNRASGQHFGVAQDSALDGARIAQSISTSSAQLWRLAAASGGCYQLANVHSGKALDNPDGSRADGTQMQQWTIGTGNPKQTWCFRSVGTGWYSIRNSASGSLLDLRDGVSGDGVVIQEWSADPAAPNANQTWQLIRVG